MGVYHLRTSFFMALSFLLIACQNSLPAEEPCNFVVNQQGRRLSWAISPILFRMDQDSFAQNPDRAIYRQEILEAMEFWNREFNEPVFRLVDTLREDDKPHIKPRFDGGGQVIPDGFNTIYMVDKEVLAQTGNNTHLDEQARATISSRGDHIYEADILIDASEKFYFEDESRDREANPEKQIHFKSLMIHELGHALGLDHVDAPGTDSVMHPILSPGQLRPEEPLPVVNKEGDVLRAAGVPILRFQLPQVDRASIACEYK